MWMRWLPWKYIVKRLARSHGFMDPIRFFSVLQNFAQPSEVAYPLELIRAGVVFHARGLMNTKVIQQNLDWVWPYWVCRQFNPHDSSFIPRGFSITHINMSHRNWTAVGVPDSNAFPIVDPSGMITPFYDGWSIDAWIVTEDGDELLPCHNTAVHQHLLTQDNQYAIQTETSNQGLTLASQTEAQLEHGKAVCKVHYFPHTTQDAWLAVNIRPYNPEGVSFISKIDLNEDRMGWSIDGAKCVTFNKPAERHLTSNYKHGDLYRKMLNRSQSSSTHCSSGLSTAAALYPLKANQQETFTFTVDLHHDKESQPVFPRDEAPASWDQALEGSAQLEFPDDRYEYLYDIAVRSLVLHTPHETYPGPYTYKRFWFRDAAFILHALCCVNLSQRIERVLDLFPSKQQVNGYFSSQNGEWDSNGEALWIMQRFCELTGTAPKAEWKQAIDWGAGWITRKRLSENKGELHDGLFPPGFSAEHLGNNDYYYWDDFWGVAGLQSAACLFRAYQEDRKAVHYDLEAEAFMASIERSLERSISVRDTYALPASPYRRMDSGSIGSIIPGYPLQLWAEQDPRVMATLEFLMQECFVHGGFFQDMIHSGINAYLTLQMAQTLMRAGDSRFHELIDAMAELASPTGQWPEAIHPRTLGGCMGDGHHVWASAEWVMMMRNMFVREEEGTLVLASGIADKWIEEGSRLYYGPTPTPYGPIAVTVEPHESHIDVSWEANWRDQPPMIEVRFPNQKPLRVESSHTNKATIEQSPQDETQAQKEPIV